MFGLFGGGNLGNEATLSATLLMLRKRVPDLQIVLVSDPPQPEASIEVFPERYNHDPLPIEWIIELVPFRLRAHLVPLIQLIIEPLRVRKIRKYSVGFDLLLVSGTGIADDFYQTPFDTPLSLLRWCKAVYSNKGKVRFISIGAGPVSHWLSKRWLRKALQLADVRTYRETTSRKFAVSVGMRDGPETVMPDIVFSLPVTDYLTQYQSSWPPKVIGLGIMYYMGWNLPEEEGQIIYEHYRDKLVSLVNSLMSRGYIVRIIIGNRTSDKLISNELSHMLAESGNDGRLIFNTIDTHQDVLKEIARSDLLIASRFHNVLKSLLLHRPVISIGYAHKNDDLMEEMGLSEFCHHIESFDVDELLDQVDSLSASRVPPIQHVIKKNAEYKKLLETQFDRVLQL